MENDTKISAPAQACCSSGKQTSCCDPSQKSGCCGPDQTGSGGCGCQ